MTFRLGDRVRVRVLGGDVVEGVVVEKDMISTEAYWVAVDGDSRNRLVGVRRMEPVSAVDRLAEIPTHVSADGESRGVSDQ